MFLIVLSLKHKIKTCGSQVGHFCANSELGNSGNPTSGNLIE